MQAAGDVMLEQAPHHKADAVVTGGAQDAITRARALANEGRLIEAGEVCAAALEKFPDQAQLHLIAAVLNGEAGRWDESERAAKRTLDRTLVLAHVALGDAIARRGNIAGARRSFENAAKLLVAAGSAEMPDAGDMSTAPAPIVRAQSVGARQRAGHATHGVTSPRRPSMIQKSDIDILRDRAKTLASARDDTTSYLDVTRDRYLSLVCGADRIVVALESVVEVFRPSSVTPLPRSVPPLWGLTPWRGSILPVVTLDGSVQAEGTGVIVTIADGPRAIAGLWANAVESEIAISADEIHPLSNATGIRALLLSGVTSSAKSVFDATCLARLLNERTTAKDRTAVNNSTGNQV